MSFYASMYRICDMYVSLFLLLTMQLPAKQKTAAILMCILIEAFSAIADSAFKSASAVPAFIMNDSGH